MYSAHSPNKKIGVDAQPYESHVSGVLRRAFDYANDACRHAKTDSEILLHIVRQAALFHDLGKLDGTNQPILLGEEFSKRLPINHVDAGAAFFLEDDNNSQTTAAVIQAHHIGFCDFIDEEKKDAHVFRDVGILEHTNNELGYLLSIHNSLISESIESGNDDIKGDLSIFLRLALSCLVDADHTDTAVHYRDHTEPPPYIQLRPEERIEKLDNYVKSLNKADDERSNLRSEMYQVCKTTDTYVGIVSCDSPVGSGKTTAIMGHLLNQARKRSLRRIIVVLPFTNIIRQSVEVYREALKLEGENPCDVVAELHHRADFQDKESRHFTALWRAPIIVTTAVTFFETLASNSPSTLRRLHELPGSAIFIDESHAALPAKLLPVALHWINGYSKEWNCYWVLASGSLSRFWNIEEINHGETYTIPELVDIDLRKRLSFYEKNRIIYKCDLVPKSLKEVSEWIVSFPGPRLVIVNTVQNAAIIADFFNKKYGKSKVEHLSTALTPFDRDKIVDRIKERLNDKSDTDWTLIATSCVEAGIDVSFRTGFRELSSLLSLLQTAGRVNRGGIYDNAEIWTFKLKESDNFNTNPELLISRTILQKYFEKGVDINPELSTESIDDELKEKGTSLAFKKILMYEELKRFPKVEGMFKVIDTDTKLVVINNEIINAIKNYNKVSWQDIQKHSVRIYGHNLERYAIEEFMPGMYKWTLDYDDFLGIMAGALIVIKAISGEGLIA
jgi:CRISPR-associated endonuclease/helicase Cas3